MLGIGNIKLLSSSAAIAVPLKVAFPSSSIYFRNRSTFLPAVSSYRRGQSGRVFPQRRGVSSERNIEDKEGMSGFNKKRAEGKDGTMKKNLQLKVRKLNPVNTICYVQILGTGMDTQDTSPSVLLFFDKQRMIFNAGEGLQRFCTEHKIKLSRINHMFLSRVCSETAGGLPGLLLTLAGIGDEGMSVNVWGPSDLKYLVDAMRSFIPNAAMIHTRSFGETAKGDCSYFSSADPIVLVEDELVKISAFLLSPNSSSLNLEETPNSFASLGNTKSRTSSLKPGDIAVIYACELPEIRGKFDPSKAASLGLRPGPKYRDLQLGSSVKSDTQDIMVHPTDVLGPSIPGPVVLIVDCPTLSHLKKLLSLQYFNCYHLDSTNCRQEGLKSVNCIIHLGPASVTNNSDYQNWMKKFGSAKHIMAGHEKGKIAHTILRSSARVTTRLNYVSHHLFPSSGFSSHNQSDHSHSGFNSSVEESISVDSISAENLLKFNLRPYSHLGLDRSSIPSLQTPSQIVSELLLEIPEIQNAKKDVSQLWHSSGKAKNITDECLDESLTMMEEPWINENACLKDYAEHDLEIPGCLENISREDMEIVLLGTGSSQPSKYRNVSSIYVNLFSKGSIFLDCGEGTLGQLKRRFGMEGADDAVKVLRLIWISHIHADHHTGLARILALRSKLLRNTPHEPLIVIGPRPLKRFLDAYSRLEDLDIEFLDCRHTTEASWNTIENCLISNKNQSSENTDTIREGCKNMGSTIFANYSRMQSYSKRPGSPVDTVTVVPILKRLKKVLSDAGLDSLHSVPVVHCPQAFGIALKAAERTNSAGKVIPGWKVVYSGDTRPCPALVDASHGATVLIHEATFEDGMEDEALEKNHSTTLEAINVGMKADVYRIILTHFSQRYPKIPVFDKAHMSRTCIGFDLMSINAADLPMLPEVVPHLKLLFKNEMALNDSEEVLDIAVNQS